MGQEFWDGVQAPTEVRLAIQHRSHRTAAEVWSLLSALPAATGWVSRPHEVVEWPCPAAGDLLAAEVHVAGGESVHVRRSPEGWSSWTYREGEGEPVLCWKETRVSTAPGRTKFGYHVYWRRLAEAGSGPEAGPEQQVCVFRPYAARFTGWEE